MHGTLKELNHVTIVTPYKVAQTGSYLNRRKHRFSMSITEVGVLIFQQSGYLIRIALRHNIQIFSYNSICFKLIQPFGIKFRDILASYNLYYFICQYLRGLHRY